MEISLKLGHRSWLKLAIDSRSHFPDLSREILRDLTNLCEILVDCPSRFGQATLNESVPSLGRQWHRVIYATCFANKEQLRKIMKQEQSCA